MPEIKKRSVVKSSTGSNYCATTIIEEDPNNTVATVQMDITNAEGQPTAEPASYILQFDVTKNGKRLFKNSFINFNSNAVGYEYEISFTMLDMYGNLIPSSVTGPIVVEQPMVLA